MISVVSGRLFENPKQLLNKKSRSICFGFFINKSKGDITGRNLPVRHPSADETGTSEYSRRRVLRR